MPPGHAGEPRFSSSARYGPAIGAGAGTAGSPGPRVGLVLGAGGVAGSAFHAGVLAAIEEVTGWDPRRATVIVGTSAGSITATSLRAGLSAADLLARAAVRPLEARPLALVAGLLPEGTIGTDLIAAGIAGLALGSWPGQPLWVCAVRARDGRLVVFGRDSRPPLPEAVAASCAIPGFFRPVSIDGDSYLDGGAHSPTNADV